MGQKKMMALMRPPGDAMLPMHPNAGQNALHQLTITRHHLCHNVRGIFALRNCGHPTSGSNPHRTPNTRPPRKGLPLGMIPPRVWWGILQRKTLELTNICTTCAKSNYRAALRAQWRQGLGVNPGANTDHAISRELVPWPSVFFLEGYGG